MSGQFRTLKEDEIEVRISTVGDNGITLLLYKTARTDANLLDEVYGVGNWQNDFSLIDGVLFGAIGVRIGTEWVWKRDAGVESYTEKEKGRASDAFKRAGFKWGIGRELYSAPFIYIPSDKCKITEKNGKKVCYDNFAVAYIAYDTAQEISEISIKNAKTGDVVFKWKCGDAQKIPPPPTTLPKSQQVPQRKPESQISMVCAECDEDITDKIHDFSVKRFGKPLCMNCQKRAKPL